MEEGFRSSWITRQQWLVRLPGQRKGVALLTALNKNPIRGECMPDYWMLVVLQFVMLCISVFFMILTTRDNNRFIKRLKELNDEFGEYCQKLKEDHGEGWKE